MLLCDDISINESIKQIQMEEVVNTEVLTDNVAKSPKSTASDMCDENVSKQDDVNNHTSIVHTSQLVVQIPSQTINCRKCGYETKDICMLDTHMMDEHGSNKNSRVIEVEDDHEEQDLTCDKCGFKAGKLEELKQHNQAKHLEVRVELHLTDMIKLPLSCSKCDYECKFNIQMKKHKQRIHPEEKSKPDSIRDIVIDIMSERYNELLQEISELRKNVKEV